MPVYYGTEGNQAPPPAGGTPSFWDRLKTGALGGLSLINPLASGVIKVPGTPTPAGPGFRQGLMNMINAPTGAVGAGLGLPKPGSIQDILGRLDELQNSDRYMPPMELLQQQARAQAAAQYDPVIARLQNQMGLAETRANRNKEALGAMFGQLSENLASEIPGIQQMYAGAEDKSANQYNALKQSITDQYAKSQADQEAMMQRLNIQAAAPDALKQQGIDRDFFVNRASTDAQTAQTALGQEERGAVEYTRKGSELAKTEGTQRQADLMYQLQDLLAQYEGQIGEAETGKNTAYLSNLYGLQNDASKTAMDRAQRDFENYIKVLQVGQSLNKAGSAMSVQSPADVAGRVLGMGIDPVGAQAVQNAFMSAISSDPMIQAGIDPNNLTALSKETLAQRVVETGRQQGLSQAQLNALQIAALEYFGRR